MTLTLKVKITVWGGTVDLQWVLRALHYQKAFYLSIRLSVCLSVLIFFFYRVFTHKEFSRWVWIRFFLQVYGCVGVPARVTLGLSLCYQWMSWNETALCSL